LGFSSLFFISEKTHNPHLNNQEPAEKRGPRHFERSEESLFVLNLQLKTEY